MVSTKKVITISAGIIAIDCILAGMAAAGLSGRGEDAMWEALAVSWTLVILLASLNVVLIRLHIKEWLKRGNERDDASKILAEALEKDTDPMALLMKIATRMDGFERAIAPIVEEFQERKADEDSRELKPL